MTRAERRLRRGAKPGKDTLYFLATFLGALMLGLPGLWCLAAAVLTVVSFLLFLHSTRGGCRRVPTSQLHPRPAAFSTTPLPRRDAC